MNLWLKSYVISMIAEVISQCLGISVMPISIKYYSFHLRYKGNTRKEIQIATFFITLFTFWMLSLCYYFVLWIITTHYTLYSHLRRSKLVKVEWMNVKISKNCLCLRAVDWFQDICNSGDSVSIRCRPLMHTLLH